MLVELNVVEVGDDVQDAVEADVVEDVSVQERMICMTVAVDKM